MKKYFLILFVFVFSMKTQSQSPITSVPFEDFGDHIILKVSVDESEPLDFIFDTGAGLTVIDEDIADKLKLKKKKARFKNAQATFHLIKHNTLAINHFLMEKNIPLYSTDFNHLEISLGRNIDGIVGYDLIHHHSIYINYDDHIIDIYNLGDIPKKGDKLSFDLVRKIPTIKAEIVLNNEEVHTGTFFVNTGAGTTLDFNSPYAKKYDVVNKTGKHYSYLVKGISSMESLHYEGHVISCSFGNHKIEDLPIGISLSEEGLQGHKQVAGIIGNQILRMFNIAIDLPSKSIYFEKNTHFRERKFNVNCSGIDLQLSKDKEKLLIHQVFENSPASKAGILLNDELVEIDGMRVKGVGLPKIQQILRKEGETIELLIARSGDMKTFSITLKSLLK